MTDSYDANLRIGGDPRSLSEFTLLCHEIGKLTHPARPDVNWHQVEQLCQGLFQQNGVELQTATYYCLARAKIAGLPGMEQGLTLVAELLVQQWPTLWPTQTPARLTLLIWLAQRLQQVLRIADGERDDMANIYRMEKLLTRMLEQLVARELEPISQLEDLCQQLKNRAKRLERQRAEQGIVPLPVAPLPTVAPIVPYFYVPRQAGDRRQATGHWLSRQWPGLLTGILGMALLLGIAWCWQWRASDPLKTALLAATRPLPVTLAPLEIPTSSAASLAEEIVPRMAQQFDGLARLSPLWAQNYARQQVRQAQRLWPHNPQVLLLTQRWQQQRAAKAFPVERLAGWQQAQSGLQQLADRLNALDEPKKRYMTVSELKSAVFAIQQPLLVSPPLEELLRQLDQQRQQQKIEPALLNEIDARFVQLLNRYALLTDEGG
jgi:type VI secretion system protein VasL